MSVIRGQFQPDLRCLLKLEVIEADQTIRVSHAKLDTAFNGEIGLPRADFERLADRSAGESDVTLADGRIAKVKSRAALVRLGEDWRLSTVLDLGNSRQPLVGIGMVLEHSICIETRPFGEIVIEPLE